MKSFILVFHQVGNNESDTSGDASHAMHEYVRPLPLFVDKLVCLLEVATYVEWFVINRRDV